MRRCAMPISWIRRDPRHCQFAIPNAVCVESSSYFDKRGMKWKGNNLYTILPVGVVMDAFYQRQLHQLKLDTELRRVLRQQVEYGRHRPRAALCASVSAPAAPDPSQQCKPLCGP